MKVYVVGPSKHYANFIYQHKPVDKMEDADVVLFTGGEDVHPSNYDDIQFELTYANKGRDDIEFLEIEKAKELNKLMVGVCRGLQIGTVAAGGKLIQHMVHPHSHRITLWDSKTKINVNSLHHQMANPYNLPKEDYILLGHSEHLSQIHFNGRGDNLELEKNDIGLFKEPEIVYYKNINFLGFQFHPEMMDTSSNAVILANILIETCLTGKLEDSVKQEDTVDEIITDYVKSVLA